LKRRLALIALAALAAVGAVALLFSGIGEHRLADEIRAFEAADRLKPPPAGAVLFVGSSSIRLWPDLQAAFPGTALVQRGFGGAELADVVHFAPRIVLPYRPSVVVLYAGENEISAGTRTEALLADLKKLVRLIHDPLPATRIVLLAVKPSPKRARFAPAIREFNQALRAFSATDPRFTFVDVHAPMTTAAGHARPELFVDDGLHMNAAGYAVWREALAPVLRQLRDSRPAARGAPGAG
jgi:lysophospholipase L1-like esterase